ncbi:MAG: acetate kinase [Saccharofermentans sp.]|jgi:acetate kinase|nr:acetate kinase [Mageeibacillus sp.]MCI1263974.1 acetate kinase [Saccharofermentans sp.]MCI1275495.1 acetate kinase [Saccharofermentans sp.]MCI2044672.1 acetate kinase [Mageeibacillus sp.]
MNILVINCGSSSAKFQLFDIDNGTVLAKGNAERIGIDGKLTFKPTGKDEFVSTDPMPDHKVAVKMILDALVDKTHGVISDISEIAAVGHRVLHGGKYYSASVIVDDDVKRVIRECFPLGPLHNPANLIGIEACEAVLPKGTPQVAVFDTAFHQTMPPKAYMYALPYEYYEKYSIRRYGFHGTSHRYVSHRVADFLGKKYEDLKIVTCHLGNGSSFAAVKDGKCQDTSMGLTPLAGICMGTRTGDIDPAIVPFIMKKEGLSPDEMDNLLNKKSGVQGISGVSSDFRDLEKAAKEGNERAQLALDMFAYQGKKIIGSYAAAMGGVDVVVFTAGIGENTDHMRAAICKDLEFMGIEIDDSVNTGLRGKEAIISKPGSKVTVCVIPTNEELAIAQETKALI